MASELDDLRLLNVGQVSELLGVSVRTIWRLSALAEIGRSSFPPPLRLSPRCVRWRLADVRQYIEQLGKEGRG